MTIPNLEEAFLKRLIALGKLSRFELDEEIIAIYDTALAQYGYEDCLHALNQIIMNRETNDPFPSVKDIRSILDRKSDPETEAVDAANRIIEALAKDGYTNLERAKRRMGELAWAVVQAEGGWHQVCSTATERNLTTLKAQWRQLALAKQKRGALGIVDAPKLHIAGSEPKQISYSTLLKQIEEKK